MRITLPILLCFCLLTSVLAQKSWQELASVEDLHQFDPELLPHLFDQFDLDHEGLAGVKAAKGDGDWVKAGQLLLDFYKTSERGASYRRAQPDVSDKTIASADTILKDVFTIQNVSGQVPYLEDGHRDWYYKGPNNDREWAWLSNRHSQLSEVLSAYFETGNLKYIRYVDLFLKDFILASMPYPAVKGSPSIWRGLEVAARAKIWTRLFYSTINDQNINPATRLLILRSLPDHAHYNRNFHSQNNWLTMEISALATVAAYFPEYKMSEQWMDYTVDTMVESMKDQVYPDGVQTELTSHYHNVTFRNFELYQQLCEVANVELPDFFVKTIEAMYSYIAHAIRPSGFRILNNDGDKGSDVSLIVEAAQTFEHPDWEYIAKNGNSGEKPNDGPSYFYPWAGQLISRSGFDADAHWSFFDVGPWGSGHQHNDKLHISIAAYGRDLLVDAGRFAYTGAVAEKFRAYARGSVGHNLLLIDGQGQAPGPRLAEEPVGENHFKLSADFDYGSHHFNEYITLEGEASHTRSMIYVRGKFWVIVDRVDTNRKREVTALWHWHPDCEVVQEKNITRTNNDRGNLAVIPIGKQKYEISQVKGQEDPLQGWYSPEYNIYGPNIASLYKTNVKKGTNMAWLLLPSEGNMPAVVTKVVSEDESKMVLTIDVDGEQYMVTVPFENSGEANVKMP